MKDKQRSRQAAVPAKAGAETPEAKAPEQVREDGAPEKEPVGKADQVRDFAAEVAELIREFPEAANGGKLPDEVVDAVIRAGKTVLEAYREYALSHMGEKSQPEPAKKSGELPKNAPVRGVSGGWPVEDQARDAFLAGFDENR